MGKVFVDIEFYYVERADASLRIRTSGRLAGCAAMPGGLSVAPATREP